MAVILSSARPVTPCRCASKPRARLPTPRTQLPRNIETHLRRALLSLSSALAFVHGGRAGALTYEEALQQSTDTGGVDFSLPDVDLNGFLNFLTENPLVAFGGVAVVTVPLVVSQLFGGSKPYAVVSAKSAYDKLLNDPAVQLVDIRSVKDAREAGSPDLRAAKKKAVAVPYNGDDKNGFVKKLGLRFKDPEDTTLIILDKFDGNSELVAELVTANGFKAAFAVKDGAEGRRGWLKSNLPWTSKKGLSFNFGGWFTNAFGDSPDGLPLTVGLAAATGLGVFAYTEIETLLQIVGSAAILQLLANKLLYAESRKTTLKQVQEFFNTKVAPQELVDEIKAIGQALLPSSGDEKSPPAAAQATSTAATPAPEATTEVKAESTTEALASVNSAPVAAESSTDSAPSAPSRPLSPYPNYPDLKPPSSPSPSTP